MDLINGIQNAVDYIEAHLTEELDYEAMRGEHVYQARTFSGFLAFCVATVSANISGRAGLQWRVQSLCRQTVG